MNIQVAFCKVKTPCLEAMIWDDMAIMEISSNYVAEDTTSNHIRVIFPEPFACKMTESSANFMVSLVFVTFAHKS